MPLSYDSKQATKVEYEALLVRLRIMKELQVKELLIHCDYMLIVN